ncbi:biopolymer transporter ExbD [uncultured Tolumonas sp.]|uniref:ExbD/TolR family protein n=1 Tax=uncultured Tolumonas sp. TaxID=263765 RepID=UPI002A0A4705|nr:biopolymer transporter ExbD [uncultured Tolumonas sp.]
MAFGKLSDDGGGQPQSEINMIPLIDVMLVLLIVFMITAPLLSNAVKVDLPQASSSPEDIKNNDIKLALKASGELFWGGEAISRAALELRLQNAAKQQPVPELHIHADRNLDYGKVADIMALSSRSGVSKIAFVSEPTGE